MSGEEKEFSRHGMHTTRHRKLYIQFPTSPSRSLQKHLDYAVVHTQTRYILRSMVFFYCFAGTSIYSVHVMVLQSQEMHAR